MDKIRNEKNNVKKKEKRDDQNQANSIRTFMIRFDISYMKNSTVFNPM